MKNLDKGNGSRERSPRNVHEAIRWCKDRVRVLLTRAHQLGSSMLNEYAAVELERLKTNEKIAKKLNPEDGKSPVSDDLNHGATLYHLNRSADPYRDGL